MVSFESEIQELVYRTLIGDTILSTYLGGDAVDERISLSFGDAKVQKISSSKPAHIVIETMPIPAPVRLGSGIEEWTERYCLHIFTKPERRDVRAAVEQRLRELLHRKTFVTPLFIIFNVFEDGRDSVKTTSDLLDYRYTVSLQFLPKGSSGI